MYNIVVNLKNSKQEISCEAYEFEKKYLKLTNCTIMDLTGTKCTNLFFKLTDIVSIEIKEN